MPSNQVWSATTKRSGTSSIYLVHRGFANKERRHRSNVCGWYCYISGHQDPEMASRILQRQLFDIQTWLDKCRIKANEIKSVHITFTTRKGNCPTILHDRALPRVNEVKYLGMYLDRRLTWTKHIKIKRKAMDLKLRKMYWLIGRKSQLSLQKADHLQSNHKASLDLRSTAVWGAARNSNLDIIQRFCSDTETNAWRPLIRDKCGNLQRPRDRNGKEGNWAAQRILRRTT